MDIKKATDDQLKVAYYNLSVDIKKLSSALNSIQKELNDRAVVKPVNEKLEPTKETKNKDKKKTTE